VVRLRPQSRGYRGLTLDAVAFLLRVAEPTSLSAAVAGPSPGSRPILSYTTLGDVTQSSDGCGRVTSRARPQNTYTAAASAAAVHTSNQTIGGNRVSGRCADAIGWLAYRRVHPVQQRQGYRQNWDHRP
jgi:hypothetical protein